MKQQQGGDFDVQSFLSKLPGLPWAKYSGEKHIPGYSYCGPGTRLDIRLDENNIPKPGEEPINRVDAACYKHDLAYKEAEDSLEKKHIADVHLIHQLNDIEDPTVKERLARLLVKGGMKAKLTLGASLNPEQDREQLAK